MGGAAVGAERTLAFGATGLSDKPVILDEDGCFNAPRIHSFLSKKRCEDLVAEPGRA